MERRFRVYVYKDGDPPIAHVGPETGTYSIEGLFIKEMEFGNNNFQTRDGREALAYFMPFSVKHSRKYMVYNTTRDPIPIRRYISDYVGNVSRNYQFWNRTGGLDHFLVACQDWVSFLIVLIIH